MLCMQTDFLFERRLNEHLFGVIAGFSKGGVNLQPLLQCCSSADTTYMTIDYCSDHCQISD